MLIKLTPEQIANNWDFLKKCIVDFSPLEARKAETPSNNILDSLLIDAMHCWVDGSIVDGKTTINAVVVTQILVNDQAGVRNLLVYSICGLHTGFSINQWKEGMMALAQFARKNKCQHIIGYTGNEHLIRLADRLGGDTSQRVVVFPLD